MQKLMEVFGISIYSLSQGKKRKYNTYDTQALLRAHQWGLLSGTAQVPSFQNGDNFIITRNDEFRYELEIGGGQFALHRSRSLLTGGMLDPDRPRDESHEGWITYYCIGNDGWHYSFHCKRSAATPKITA